MIHPYKKTCDKYQPTEYDKFFMDLEKNFDFQEITGTKLNNSKGLLTGYYEPAIKAYSYPKKGSYPIYKNPKEISDKFNHQVSRKTINQGYLENYNLEIAWVENEIEAFFLHIQGSGRLILENDEIIKIRYAGSNKKKYSSLGRILINRGILKKEEVDMHKIKEWLYKDRKRARKFMNFNERYIFFEEYSGEIKGSAGVNLVPNISIAVDKRFIKKGEAIIIQSMYDINDIFVGVAHDEGIAIKGKSRIDLFTGFGHKSENKAALLKKKIFTWKVIQKK
ncbi:MAG: hypothetical protein CMJ08_03170 [Pelagibacterales bacterium]|nr:hypothetical protein [Pelagibacterales bacterium]|tara:strand:- start:3428 stop:4264 length:837 start_codon:yes stop_codon:yes gene_type:complete